MPAKWVTYKSAATYYAKNQVIWTIGEEFITLHGGKSPKTGKQSTMDIKLILAVKTSSLSRGFKNRAPRLTNAALYKRDNHHCAYCGDTFPLSKLSRDHVHPTSKGGSDEWSNCVTSCLDCNNHKTDKTLEEYGKPLLYKPIIPSRPEYLLFTNMKCSNDEQKEYLRKFIK